MTLTTHVIIAAAATKPFTEFHPAIVFGAALVSHYLSDAIPHWDYNILSFPDKSLDDVHPVRSQPRHNVGAADTPEAYQTSNGVHKRKWNFGIKTFWIDILRIGSDFFIGSIILWLILRPGTPTEWLMALLIIAGGTLPDFLQGVYYTRKANFIKPLHIFHDLIHTKIKLGPYPLIGIPFQAVIFIAAAWFLL